MKDISTLSLGHHITYRKKRKRLPSHDHKNRQHAIEELRSTSFSGGKASTSEDDKFLQCNKKNMCDKHSPQLTNNELLKDLDDIFESVKPVQEMKSKEIDSSSKKSKNDKIKQNKESAKITNGVKGNGSIVSPNPPVHRYDKATGLPVYKYTALLVGDGGGTSQCPFDCDCCF